MRHSLNFRMNARRRPHRLHRLYFRALNFGFRSAFTINDILANALLHSHQDFAAAANGMPSNCSSSRASLSVFAVVTIVMSMP